MLDIIKKNTPVVVALILALIAGILVYVTLKAAQPSTPVVVASVNLSIGETIAPNSITVKNYPASVVPATSFSSAQQVVGKTVTAAPVLSGDMVRSEHLSVEGSLISALLSFSPPGWVAVELPDGTGMGLGGIRRGDQVNIYADAPQAGTAPVVKNAVILSTPWTVIGGQEKAKSYVVAVPPDRGPALAELLVLNKRVAIVLVKGDS